MIGIASFVAGMVASRFQGPGGPWLWNFDMPFFDFPVASFFHDALAAGHLPLWNNELGLGFPLYAEGQIGAFYPPHWVLFQLPPLQALDATRLLHLAWLGIGTGLLAHKLSGSRLAAVMAAVAIVLSGGLVAKLEWTNLMEGFAWVPWILIPLVRWPHPTRAGLVAAGIMWGVAALTGHPNIWMLTGITAAAVVLGIRPRLDSVARLVGLGLIAAGVGAVQLIPTAILWTLSVRVSGLDEADLFRLTAMPFDLLGAAFANVFVKAADPAVNLNATWYPGGTWAPLEVSSYVGLPIIALAVVGARARRARPFLVAVGVLILLPLVGGQRLDIWAAIPVWNGLHAPVKGYMFLDLALVLLAAIGLGRLKRGQGDWRPAALVSGVFVAGYTLVAGIVLLAPGFFQELVRRFWSWTPPGGDVTILAIARDVLGSIWPVVLEIAIGVLAIGLIAVARRRRAAIWPRLALVAAAIVPLALLSPPFNQSLPREAFDHGSTNFVQTVAAQRPYRVLTVNVPLFWAGMPDQLAAARIADIAMFTSLNLKTSNDLTSRLRLEFPSTDTARAVGIDTVAVLGAECPGVPLATAPEYDARICRIAGLASPYWVPTDAVVSGIGGADSVLQPEHVDLDPKAAIDRSRPGVVLERSDSASWFLINAPAAGWVFIDRAWWPGWQTTVDGVAQQPREALGGQLVAVTSGSHVIKQSLVPWDVAVGLVVGLVTILLALLWVQLGPRPLAVPRPQKGWARRLVPRLASFGRKEPPTTPWSSGSDLDPLAVRILGQSAARSSRQLLMLAMAGWFAVQSYSRLSAFVNVSVPLGLDARIYYRGAEAWLAGQDPWGAFVTFARETYHYFGWPATTVVFAPATLIPEDLFIAIWLPLSALAAVFIVRRLRLPLWWLLFPPITEGVFGGNPQIVLLALLLAGSPLAAGLAVAIKVYAIVPLIGERRFRAIGVAVVIVTATFIVASNLWIEYFQSFGSISDRLAIESYLGHSGYYFPALFWPSVVALGLLAFRDLRMAAWLAVPAIWPASEFHYTTFALPVMTPILAVLLAVPRLRLPPVAIILAIAWILVRQPVRNAIERYVPPMPWVGPADRETEVPRTRAPGQTSG